MDASERTTADRAIAFLLGALAFVVYVLTLSGGAFPGQSAGLVAQHTPLFPRLTPSHPLWWTLSSAAAALPIGGLATRLNLLSAVCGAVCVGMMYVIVRETTASIIQTVPSTEERARFASRLAAIAAAGFLAFCMPFWVASNRAYTASFDTLLLLSVTWLFFRYVHTGRPMWTWLFALAYGVGTAEFATLIIFAPLFGASLLFLLWRREDLTLRSVLVLVACSLAGLSLYFLGSWVFYGSAGYELGEYTGYWHVVWLYLKEHYLLIKRSLPRVGWLIVLVTTAVPFLTALFVARRALNEEKDWGFYLLHLVMTVIAVGLLLNLPFAPWRTLGLSRLLVTPYMVMAGAFGYLVAYWYLLPFAFMSPDEESAVKRWLSRRAGPILAALLMLLVPVSAVLNAPEANARGSAFINDMARQTLYSLSGRTWLVTDGVLDRQIAVAAHDMGQPVRLIDLSASHNEVYLRYVASLFDSPRLKNMADIGLFALLREWFASDPDITEKVALKVVPDLWVGAGYTVVPYRTVFLGSDDPGSYQLDSYLTEQLAFWEDCADLLETTREATSPEGPIQSLLTAYRDYLRRQLGRLANDAGVFVEEQGENQAATEAYGMARRIDPRNVSAVLNLAVMVDRGDLEGDVEVLKDDLRALASDPDVRRRLWALSQNYGYVRAPQAFVQSGMAWARSGMPGLAAAGFRRALNMLPKEGRRPIKEAMADLYSIHREDERSEALYYELLVENPKNVQALMGSARIAARKGDFEKAREYLERAQAAEAPTHIVATELAATHIMAGNFDEARILLEEVIDMDPKSVRALSLLAGVAIEQGDFDTARRQIDALRKIEEAGTVVPVLEGKLALAQNDLAAARSFFNTALTLQGDFEWVLVRLLGIDLAESRMDLAENDARRVLRLNPDNALANYVMGSVRTLGGEPRLAEDFLRRSIGNRKTPEALNDLAWLLSERGELQEAETLVRSALEMNNTLYNAWDTLGSILMKTGRLSEAEKAFDRALSLFQNDMEVFLHMAELRVRQGSREQAQELLDMLLENQSALSPADVGTLQDLRARMRE